MKNINAKTKLCIVVGNPIEHSLSPALHNAGYKKLGLNFVYTAFKVEDVENMIKGIRALGIRGVSVTIPHKVTVIPFLDSIHATARKIGAVNTILNNGGELIGYNTDCEGATHALKEVLGKKQLKGKKVILVGAGGAARAIAFGLKQEEADVLLLNRTLDKAKELGTQVGTDFGDLSRLPEIKKADILIHATRVGMNPNSNDSLIPTKYLHKNLVVFDIVYSPKETKLIKDAKRVGCKIVYGYKMLLYQAVAQFELYTGYDAPVKVMEKALLRQLERK